MFYYFRRAIWLRGSVRFRDNPRVYIAQRAYMVFKGLFVENHWGYAAQLTFNTMMAIIPVFAVIFAVGRGFGFEGYIADWCRRVFVSQPAVADAIMALARSYIGYTQTGVVIGVSLVMMLYSVISLFDNIENVFNGIWAVKKERSLVTAIIDYTAIVFLVPLVIVLLSGLSVFFYSVVGQLPHYQLLTPLVRTAVRLLLPLGMLTAFFTLMFAYLPNTRVRLSMVWFPALLAGLCIIGLQMVYVHFQVLFSSYNLIYGSLAALPLLLLWMQLSWFICIGFAELGRANQELADGHIGEDRRDSLRSRLRRACVVLSMLCRQQREGGGPMSQRRLLHLSHYSHAQLTDSLSMLIRAHLVARTHTEDGSEVYTLNHSADDLTMGMAVEALLGRRRRLDDNRATIATPTDERLEAMLTRYLREMDEVRVEEV